MTNKLRKQIRFRNEDELKLIDLAIEIVSKTLTRGERLTFSSFVRAAATAAARNVIKAAKKEGG